MPEPIKSFAWRLVHRPIPILLVVFFMWQMHRIVDWYMKNPDIGFEESAGLGAVVAGAFGFFRAYVDSDGK